MSDEKEVTKRSKEHFMHECTELKLLGQELCLTIKLSNICTFYQTRIGIHPVLESWEELRKLLENVLNIAKGAKGEGQQFHIRFVGGTIPVWLVMRIYALCVYEADALFYAGDCIIKI